MLALRAKTQAAKTKVEWILVRAPSLSEFFSDTLHETADLVGRVSAA